MKNLKEALKRGEILIGGFSLSASPAIVEMMGYAGLDFVVICCEQGLVSPIGSGLENLIRAAYAADITPFVRVTENDRGMILKALNYGAKGIVVPHVYNKQEMVKAVEACRYPPKGRRGAVPFARFAGYGFFDFYSSIERSDKEVSVWPLIEDKEAMEDIENMLEVEGIDAIFFGPFDMALDYGVPAVVIGEPGRYHHHIIQENMEKVIRLCNAKKIPVITIAYDIESMKQFVKAGVSGLIPIVDFAGLKDWLRSFVDEINKEIRPMKRVGYKKKV